MRSEGLRESFLEFFESKGATRRPSSSLIPDDPSLLLTTAGMVQFKRAFLGVSDLGFSSATTCQKCVRTTDIETVGHTGRHHTFFEMLGNFSFGDYFKSEACAWAYEFCVDVMGLDPERIWYSIFEDDDETEKIWIEEVGVPAERIVRLGAKDNFWAAGPTGPCGPCSELYFDQGAEIGCGSPECSPGCDCDRFLEFWNLVFMQFDRDDAGNLTPLPKQNIDTGMGLERMASILQGVTSNFETDILRRIIAVAEELTGIRLGESAQTDVSLRILADHGRTVTFLIADGVLPSNEGRGYVLRRVLRRAVRHGRLLGLEKPFLAKLAAKSIELMGRTYPEVVEHEDLIVRVIESEEERFGATLRQGLAYLEEEMEATTGAVFDGTKAFTLHDTFGFPLELTAEIAEERGLSVDMEAFEAEMEAQRQRGRAAVKDEAWHAGDSVYAKVAAEVGETPFVGYSRDESDTTIVAIIVDGVSVEEAQAPAEAEIVLAETPFYAEQGGQVGDTGTIIGDDSKFVVSDTKPALAALPVHRGTVEEGVLRVGDAVAARVDAARRERIRRNHTATHLLHWALRLVLGEHVRQSGSHVAPDRFRFDFTHFAAVSDEELRKTERLVNAKIMENHPVIAYETSLASAKEAGVTALFGEKYADFVRVLEVGNFSKELCGGTHVSRTTEIGLLKIAGEGSVGANLRRIEAVTSFDAMETVYEEESVLAETTAALRVLPAQLVEKVERMQEEIKALRRKAEISGSADVAALSQRLLGSVQSAGYPLVIGEVPGEHDNDALRSLSDGLRARLEGGAVVLAARSGGRVLLLAAGSDAAIEKGFDAGAVIKQIAPLVGGGGGGKPSMAQAGGKDASGIEAALEAAREMLLGKT